MLPVLNRVVASREGCRRDDRFVVEVRPCVQSIEVEQPTKNLDFFRDEGVPDDGKITILELVGQCIARRLLWKRTYVR